MADDDLERRLRQLEHDHRLTRWYTGRVDRDLAEIAATQVEHTDTLGRIEARQTEDRSHLVSIDAQLQSLTQMVGQVLERLPKPDNTDD